MKEDSEAAAARLVTGIIISPSGHFGVYSTLQQTNIKLSRLLDVTLRQPLLLDLRSRKKIGRRGTRYLYCR